MDGYNKNSITLAVESFQSPERCPAGESLLGGKDPAGRCLGNRSQQGSDRQLFFTFPSSSATTVLKSSRARSGSRSLSACMWSASL